MEKESIFVTKLQVQRRIVIPKGIVEALGLKKGDKIEVRIKKM
jgi:AbrB family looped-hinge helix DNA binding protein